MFRKPLFWAVFILVSVLCTAWAVMHFAEAFPLVTLEVKMDRAGALAAAEDLATDRGWGPEEARQAVVFRHDGAVQSFVELEAGGKAAYAEVLGGDLYSPYTWVVRRFREGETNESVVRFRPDGTPYGFREKLPEDEPGAALESEAARELAVAAVSSGWQVDFGAYELVEASQEVRPGGRIDHTLVYERPDLQIGDGRYRLRLVVSGDRFTELTHFVKIPEAFQRRFQGMRSANDGIATASAFAIAILYMAGGCIVGLFFLMRDRWVVWKPALKWALFIAFLQVLVVLNQWPLLWMGYDTAVSSTTFVLQQVGIALAQLIGMGALLALSFMAAESLGRRAFPRHVQLWQSWKGEVAASRTMLGYTVTGYLLIGIFFAYEVGLYFLANRHLGWWTPSDALIDPNVLANIFPWLTSIAISLQAGFWEECLFRAVPIAAAALLGRRFGKPWLWITGAMILQAVIFGAGHANYPAQPAYARLVELTIPALGFGGLYLLFGLVPAIIFHFAYDVVWFALPLFAADTPGIWLDRGLVILLALIPLWVVLRARRRAGSWGEVPEADLNSSWSPPPPAPVKERGPIEVSTGLRPQMLRLLAGLGVAGVLAWALIGSSPADAPVFESGDREARTVAREALADRGFTVEAPWRELSTVQSSLGIADRFVWREGGEDAYRELLGRYLPTPRRLVRYARFEGDVAERAEEYRVYVGPDAAFQRVVHQLPEAGTGVKLEEDQARTIALAAIETDYGLASEELVEVSAEPSKLPERRDWNFVFKDSDGYPMESGEARIVVTIAGDEVAEMDRFIHVPEEWERAERNRRSVTQVVRIMCSVIFVLLFITGAVVAVVRWSRGRFAVSTFVRFCGLLAVMGVIQLANGFRSDSSHFLTAQPWALQTMILIIGGLIAFLGIAAVNGLLVGLAHRWLPPQPAGAHGAPIAAGLGLGALLAGISEVVGMLAPQTMPFWPNFVGAADSVPLVAAVLGPVGSWISSAALLLFIVAVINAVTDGWRQRRALVSTMLTLLGLVMVGRDGVESVPLWLVGGLITGLVLLVVWVLVLRHHPALVPLVTAGAAILATLREAFQAAYPGALTGSLVGAAIILALAIWWFRLIGTDTAARQMDEPPQNPEGAAVSTVEV
ncbi:MAG: CPBP family intramembrane metalloprotease [Thermoanaerobaculales bacterium]|nr:CPBP family intramembrane metalloprotease [Thermoanaerobaculales bacterium]